MDDQHFRRLEHMFRAAPINRYYKTTIEIEKKGYAVITLEVSSEHYHAANAVHGAICFKALDEAAFFAANSLFPDVFVLTTSFHLNLLRPATSGVLTARGSVVSSTRSSCLAEAELFDEAEAFVGKGSGTFVRSKIPLGPDLGYA